MRFSLLLIPFSLLLLSCADPERASHEKVLATPIVDADVNQILAALYAIDGIDHRMESLKVISDRQINVETVNDRDRDSGYLIIFTKNIAGNKWAKKSVSKWHR